MVGERSVIDQGGVSGHRLFDLLKSRRHSLCPGAFGLLAGRMGGAQCGNVDLPVSDFLLHLINIIPQPSRIFLQRLGVFLLILGQHAACRHFFGKRHRIIPHLREKFISAVHMQLADRQGRKCGFRPAALLPDPSGKLGELHPCADILPLVQIGREVGQIARKLPQ